MEENRIRREASDLKDSLRPKGGLIIGLIILLSTPILIVCLSDGILYELSFLGSFSCILGFILLETLILRLISKDCDMIQEKRVYEWKEEHPDDPRNKYL